MKFSIWRLCAVVFTLLFSVPQLRAETESKEAVGTFRFALRELPPILAPAPPFLAYLKNGRNENPYTDDLPSGSVVGIVQPRAGATAARAERSAPMTTYRLVLVTTKGQFTMRRYDLEGDEWVVRLLFPNSGLYGPGQKPTEAALRKAFGRHIAFEGKEKP